MRPAPAGTMTVVLGPGLAGHSLCTKAIGHGRRATSTARAPPPSRENRKKSRGAGVTVVDDGTIPGRRGVAFHSDASGNCTNARNSVIDDGRLRATSGLPYARMEKRPAPAGMGAVVHDGTPPRRDFVSDLPGEGGGALAVEVALQAVADRLVQENARPAGPSTTVMVPAVPAAIRD